MIKNTLFFLCALAIKIGIFAVFFAETADARPVPESFADLVEQASPSVVNVSIATKPKKTASYEQQRPMRNPFEGQPLFDDLFREFFEGMPLQELPTESLGSGVIISKDGYVLTNNHVIDRADDIVVKLNGAGEEYTATVVGKDPKNDIALLKIEAKDLPAAELGDSDKIRVGDWVMAIGNPFGLGGTVTAGIISARGRNINQGPYDDFLQTDAAINPGNSGGPLFDMDGKIVGINTAILSRTGGSQGIGFAIPANTIKLIVEQIKEHGRPVRGWLGVRIQPVTKELAEAMDLSEHKGALVAGVVDNSPADKAGFKEGDVIVKFDGKNVSKMQDLPKMVAETNIGKDVKVDTLRAGKSVRLTVHIEELAEDQDTTAVSLVGKDEDKGFELAGMILSTLNEESRKALGVEENVVGVLVERVEPASRAARSGLRPGDILLRVNKMDVKTPEDVEKALNKKKDKSALVLMYRSGDTSFIALKKEDDEKADDE